MFPTQASSWLFKQSPRFSILTTGMCYGTMANYFMLQLVASFPTTECELRRKRNNRTAQDAEGGLGVGVAQHKPVPGRWG